MFKIPTIVFDIGPSVCREKGWRLWLARRVLEKILDEDYCRARSGAKFEISKISSNLAAGDLSRAQKYQNFFADANFNALRRRCGHF